MILVTTIGSGSMDLYVTQLAQHLDVPKLYSDVYENIAELFHVSWLSRDTLRAVREDWRFVRQLNRLDDLIHLPNHHLGRYGNFLRCPFVITVHDLIRYFDLQGETSYIQPLNSRARFYLRLDYRGIKKAVHIIAVSQATRQDLVQHLGIPPERISVVYEGIDHALFRPVAERKFAFPYVLFVGSEHRRKNFTGLLRAFHLLKQDPQFAELKLVKVGRAGRPAAPFRAQTVQVLRELHLEKEVIFTEWVPKEDLPVYYAGAACFVLPSLYEGFGFPPLEAMACGCPVVVSHVASLPEVTGEAALTVAPHDVQGLAQAMREVLTNDALRRSLVAKGLKRARLFTWERTAKETLQVYQTVEKAYGHRRLHAPWPWRMRFVTPYSRH